MRFISHAKTAVCAAALIAAMASFAAQAQDAAQPADPAAPATAQTPAAEPARNPTDVVARVGDVTITEADVALAREQFGSELGQVPPEQQRSVLIDALVNMQLLAQEARAQGLEQGPEFDRRLEFLKLQALRNAFVEKNIVGSLTPEDLQKGYETVVLAEHKPEEQIRARHILVDDKAVAEKIIADLKAGAAFEELAKQSKDPSGQNGGDLGFFGRGQMVPPFEQAAFALEPGAITEEPVESEFGWHVIKLEEKRMSQPPALEEVESELRNYLMRQKFEQVMTDLRGKYTVEIVGQPAAPGAAPAAGEAPAGEAAPESGEAPADPAATPPAEPATGETPQN
jgi:peptidyl-prolyl cis-trans isomerase C